MKKTSKKLARYLESSQRRRYPKDEANYPWLSTLLDTYHILDTGISLELKKEELKRKAKVVCHKGCRNCCLKPMVPIIEPEIWGISWYASEKLEGHYRKVVKDQLLHHTQTTQCPFLVDTVCTIYPVRPTACRIFFMFGVPCEQDEDVSKTRPNDMWVHSRDLGRKVAMKILPLYGITGKSNKLAAFEDGYIHSVSRLMHELSWIPLYDNIKRFDLINKQI